MGHKPHSTTPAARKTPTTPTDATTCRTPCVIVRSTLDSCGSQTAQLGIPTSRLSFNIDDFYNEVTTLLCRTSLNSAVRCSKADPFHSSTALCDASASHFQPNTLFSVNFQTVETLNTHVHPQSRTSRFNASSSEDSMRNVEDCHQLLDVSSSPSVHRGRSGVCQLLLSGPTHHCMHACRHVLSITVFPDCPDGDPSHKRSAE